MGNGTSGEEEEALSDDFVGEGTSHGKEGEEEVHYGVVGSEELHVDCVALDFGSNWKEEIG